MKLKRPHIRTILISINLVILILPLASIGLLRLYESTLIRKTESSLIAQSAFISATYQYLLQQKEKKHELETNTVSNQNKLIQIKKNQIKVNTSTQRTRRSEFKSRQINKDSKYDRESRDNKETTHSRWQPNYAVLDLSTSKILPRMSDPKPGSRNLSTKERVIGNALSKIMLEAQIHTLAGMRLVSTNGIIIASTSNDIGMSIAHWNEVTQSLTGLHISSLHSRHTNNPSPTFQSISRGARVRVFVATPIIYKKQVIAAIILSRTPATLAQSLYNNLSLLAVIMLALIIIVMIVSIITSILISKPLRAVSEQAKQIAAGAASNIEPLKSPRTIEVQELSSAVIKMGKALEKRANYLQDFASQVSHAFKTPLTAIQGAIELLKEHYSSMSKEERSRFLNNLESDAKYLESLVNRLLDLARADTSTEINGTANITQVVNRIIDRANNKGVKIRTKIESENIIVDCDPASLESILQNLVDNSIQHGKAPIEITINALNKDEKRIIQIQFSDCGSGISSSNIKSIFTPFFTTAREQGGTGLGLAVIKTLLENYEGNIRYNNSQQGACFEIQLNCSLNTYS